MLTGLHPADRGTIRVEGRDVAADVRRRDRADRAAVQLVAQNPAEALHPRQPVRTALLRPLRLLRGLTGPPAAAEVERLLAAVGLPRTWADACRQSCPAGSASGLRSPGHWPPHRAR